MNCLEFPCASYHSFRSTERCLFFAFCYRAKEVLQRRSVHATVTQTDQTQNTPSTSKSDSDLLRENEAIFRFCPPEGNMTKSLDGLPPFTFNSIVRYVRTSGKNIKHTPDYMVMKPFERGVNFCIEGYIHNVFAKHHAESDRFYFRALCYRSLRKSETPHKIKLAISVKEPYDVLGSSCTCVAGSLGFCNHAIGLMYLISHYYMAKTKVIPDDLVCTSLPQQWHKPRGKKISSEPLMEMVFKKPKLDLTNGSTPKNSPGISCSLYQAMKFAPSSAEIGNFKTDVQQINQKFGLSLYMDAGTEMVPTKAGPAPLGGYLSYQLAPTEGNFKVTSNIDLSMAPANNERPITVYPPFPISTVCPLFSVTQCPLEHQSLLHSLQVSEQEAAKLEKDTVLQRNNDQWWMQRRPRITASQFGDVIARRSVSNAFLKVLVGHQTSSTSNMPDPLKHGIEHESTAINQYTNYLKHSGHPVKTFPSGFVVNPAFPFLGCSPDGKVLDCSEDTPFGILEIKCPYKHRAVTPETACHGDSQFHLEIKDDFPALKTTHKYYYQVQGQMGITGAKWCDFVTYTFKGMAIERIYFDDNFFSNMLLKLEQFFFKHYAKYLKSTNSQQQVVPEGACANTPPTVTVSASASSSSSTG